MCYHHPSCDLLVGAGGHEVYRLNLEQGRFLNPLATHSPAINVTAINPANQMWAFGGEDGHVEFWDHRYRKVVGRFNAGAKAYLSVGASDCKEFPEITALSFKSDGLTYACGTKTGQVLVYDIRNPNPILVKDHHYEMPIKKIEFLPSATLDHQILSADSKSLRIWNADTGKSTTTIEPENDAVNDFLVDSGLIMTANEGSRMNIFFVPSLGTAPKWCSFLDSLTEELEESHLVGDDQDPQQRQNVWDDYKFVTLKDLTRLSLDHLVGTKMLKPYMHGYFVDLRLYEKARAIANPFLFEDHKKQKAKQKLEKERESRISAKAKKLPKINRSMAKKYLQKQESKHNQDDAKDALDLQNPIGDDRFAEMFKDPSFEIDENDDEYLKHHTASNKTKNQISVDNFDAVDTESSSSEASELEGKPSDEEDLDSLYADSDDSGELESSSKLREIRKNSKKHGKLISSGRKKDKLKFYEAEAGKTWDKLVADGSSANERRRKSIPFSERLKSEEMMQRYQKAQERKEKMASGGMRRGGAMSMSYKVSNRSKRTSNQKLAHKKTHNHRRSMRNLK